MKIPLIPYFAELLEFHMKNNVIYNEEAVSLALLVVIAVLKLVTNVITDWKRFREMLISFPNEITFLILGYLVTLQIEKGGELDFVNWMTRFLICLLILIIQCFFEASIIRDTERMLLNIPKIEKVGVKLLDFICVVIMYFLAIWAYLMIMFKGWFIG